MSTVTLHEGDNRNHLRRLIAEGVRVHSVICDPPYGLTSVTKRFGGDKAAPAKFGTDGAFARASGGFMGSKWDATGIERDPEFWRLIYDILLPGGYVLAFSSPRTGHWQACAMEMAGFVMHPFFGWVYGSGFPKAHNAAKAIDKQVGFEGSGDSEPWNGWAYGAQSMKPALEPIYFAQKPFSEKNGALNLLEHGVGAVNIDGCRVAIDPVADASQLRTMQRGQRSEDQNGQEWGMSKLSGDTPIVVRPEGRHPANLLHNGSDDVLAMFPAKAGASAPVKGSEPSSVTNGIYGEFAQRLPGVFHGDSGSAARFFNSFPTALCPDCGDTGLSAEGEPDALHQGACGTCGGESACTIDAEPLRYQSKATKADRAGSKHPTVKPIPLMRWLCRLVTPPGGVVLDPFGGSGTTGAAAIAEGFQCILMEAEPQFAADIRTRFGLARPAFHYCSEFDDVLGGVAPEIEDVLG